MGRGSGDTTAKCRGIHGEGGPKSTQGLALEYHEVEQCTVPLGYKGVEWNTRCGTGVLLSWRGGDRGGDLSSEIDDVEIFSVSP